jgi:chromosome segregation ATPase
LITSLKTQLQQEKDAFAAASDAWNEDKTRSDAALSNALQHLTSLTSELQAMRAEIVAAEEELDAHAAAFEADLARAGE